MSQISETIHRLKEELPSDVELVAVSKFHPVSAVVEAYMAGQRVFGESRPQELSAKISALREIAAEKGDVSLFSDIRWHFIGHLQTNKLKLVLPYADMVESVDSVKLLEAIDRWGKAEGRVTDVLLEYHIASEETKQGFESEQIKSILCSQQTYGNIRFRGLMGMATLTDDESVIRADFSRLTGLRDFLLKERGSHPCLTSAFDTFSFGMTHDYRIAVSMGATTVRIGTMIFGERV